MKIWGVYQYQAGFEIDLISLHQRKQSVSIQIGA